MNVVRKLSLINKLPDYPPTYHNTVRISFWYMVSPFNGLVRFNFKGAINHLIFPTK